METKKDLMMYFQTSIRNVGLYTSISFAALGYSRFYREKNAFYNIYLIIFSIIFTVISIIMCSYLIQDVEKFQENLQSQDIKKWIQLPKIIIFFNSGALLLCLITLYKEFTDENNSYTFLQTIRDAFLEKKPHK